MLAFQESPVVDSPPSLLLGNCFDVMGAVPCSWVSAGIALPGEGSSGRGVPSHISHSHPQRVYSTVKISIRRWKSSPRCLLCSPLLPGFVSPGFYNRGLRASRVASVQLPKSSESRRAAGGCFRTPKPTSFSVIHVPFLQPPPPRGVDAIGSFLPSSPFGSGEVCRASQGGLRSLLPLTCGCPWLHALHPTSCEVVYSLFPAEVKTLHHIFTSSMQRGGGD